ncbi:coiled-coil domain-containing protein 180-like isoform X2 [Rhopilema esculentum]|uniref:coiled-coil domain-containing protein 180-like isoform X2 n=1 Tax=Rhopilema esculentum TaxID=499914 RepID=UPI0031DE9A0F
MVVMSVSSALPRSVEEKNVHRSAFTGETYHGKSVGNARTTTSKTEPNIPVAKSNLSKIESGILTEKQKLWTRAKPNEGDIENPVLKKLQKQIKSRREEVAENTFASQEVRGLSSDFKVSKIENSNGILERIQLNRKERHDAIVSEMHEELALINSELEPQITEACVTVKEYLEQDQLEIMKVIKLLENNEDLVNFSLKDLDGLWKQVESHTQVRHSWVEELDLTLSAIETDRATLIEEVYKAYTQRLVRVAHLMPPDVHRLMEDECLGTNQTLLSNKRYCANLIKRLKMADMEKERKYYLHWKTRVEDWKSMKTEMAIEGFTALMTSSAMNDPPNVHHAMNSLVTEQTNLNQRRLQLFNQLREMKPPGSTKTAVYQWHNSLTSITEQLDDVHKRYMGILRVNYEKALSECEEELVRVKTLLFNEGVCNEEDIEQISTDHLSPLVGEKRARFEYELDKYEKYTDEIPAAQKQLFKMLFKFLLGAAHVWDTHEIGLTREERELQERLDKNRREHDTQNQIKEAKLDIVMDRMRQDPSEEALNMSLKQSLEMLEEIKKSYHDFQTLQIKTAKQYPFLVEGELKSYSESVCSYFGVTLNKPKKTKEELKANEDTGVEEEATKASHEEEPCKDQAIHLSSGVIYYLVNDKEEPIAPPDTTATTRTNYTFLTDNLDEMEVMPYVASFEISDILIDETKELIRKDFLEHLEFWKTDAINKSENLMAAKIEELNNELDLRLHLHEPRPNRAEKDVHNVRAAELVVHRERVTQHCQGILNSLSTFKSRFSTMIHEHDSETEKFKISVESLENTFVSATKSHELLSIKDEVSNQLDEYMKVIRASLRKFRQDLDEMLNNLRNSNARFRRMLKIFSEGGNFCPEEVEEFRKKLEHMATKIDNAEGSMMAELEGMETRRLDAAHEYSGKLEERFKHHLFDLTYLEKISRWLTNIQVKIKSEVANSNTQAQKLAKMIATFDRRIDAVLRPNLDREQINASQLHETLMPILEAFHHRVKYLDCAVDENAPSTLAELQSTLSKTDPKQEETKLTSKRSRKQKGSESSISKSSRTKIITSSKSSTRFVDSDQRPGTVPATRISSKASVLVKASSESDGEKLSKTKSGSNTQSSVSKLSTKYDKKYLAFGDGTEEIQDHFPGHIVRICREGLDGLLVSSDMYYRQKGSRSATRPSAIHDNFDMCAESMINRLQSYQVQAEDYRNTCIQELRAQVETFGKSLVKFPPLIMSHVYKQYLSAVKRSQETSRRHFATTYESLERQKKENQTLLRPTLGHPGNRNELDKLQASEESRKIAFADLVTSFIRENQEIQSQHAIDFTTSLNDLTLQLLAKFDVYLTKKDIQQGQLIPKPKTEKQLLREKMSAGNSEKTKKDNDEPVLEEWKTLSIDHVLMPGSDESGKCNLITTRKVTDAHKAVIEARNFVYKECVKIYRLGMDQIDEESTKFQQEAEKWTENWNRSIQKIKDLY